MIKALCPAFDNLLYPSSVSSDKTQQRELKYIQHPLEHLSFFSFCDVKCSVLKYWHCNMRAGCNKHAKRRMLLPALRHCERVIYILKKTCLNPLLLLCITEMPKVTLKQFWQHRNSSVLDHPCLPPSPKSAQGHEQMVCVDLLYPSKPWLS